MDLKGKKRSERSGDHAGREAREADEEVLKAGAPH